MFNGDIAIVDKRRPEAGKSEVMNIIGDVNQKHAVLVDDISFFTINKTLHKKATISYQAINNNFIYYMSMMIAMFYFSRGEQCSENRFTGDCLWRYSWSVL